MATTFDVIYLGTAVDLDPAEGGTNSGNAAAINGTTFGDLSDPLFANVQSWSPGTTGSTQGSNSTDYDANNAGSSDTFRIDGGPDQIVDAVVIYNATITYMDGTTDTLLVNVVQGSGGGLYLVPQETFTTDQAKLEAGPILTLTIDSVSNDSATLGPDRYAADFATGVDGTAAGESMSFGYTDADGDQVTTGDDVISGNGGNYTISGGGDKDLILVMPPEEPLFEKETFIGKTVASAREGKDEGSWFSARSCQSGFIFDTTLSGFADAQTPLAPPAASSGLFDGEGFAKQTGADFYDAGQTTDGVFAVQACAMEVGKTMTLGLCAASAGHSLEVR